MVRCSAACVRSPRAGGRRCTPVRAGARILVTSTARLASEEPTYKFEVRLEEEAGEGTARLLGTVSYP